MIIRLRLRGKRYKSIERRWGYLPLSSANLRAYALRAKNKGMTICGQKEIDLCVRKKYFLDYETNKAGNFYLAGYHSNGNFQQVILDYYWMPTVSKI